MDVTIRGNNMTVTENMEEYALEKLDKLERYLPNISSVHVELAHQNSNRGPDMVSAQITVKHKRGAILRAEEKLEKEDHNTIKQALNGAIDKMYRRIRRFKGKRENRRRDAYMATPEELLVAEAMPEELALEEEQVMTMVADEQSQIVRRKRVATPAMNEYEAIEQMELLGHTFFMFYNGDTEEINVVYKRKAGGYGLISLEIQ